jgi:hypothetical protein
VAKTDFKRADTGRFRAKLMNLYVKQRAMRFLHKPGFYEIMLHAAAWLVYMGFQVLTFGKQQNNYSDNVLISLFELPSQLFFTYMMLGWLIPRYYLKHQYLRFAALSAAIFAIAALVHRYGYYFLFLAHFRPDQFGEQQPWQVGPLLVSAFYLITSSGLIIAFQMMRYGFRQRQLNQQLVNATLSAELKSLKDQINPHFLFNTLNNLYGLTRKNPEKAAEVAMRLSQLMHYMLYEGNMPKVSLQKEIEYLHNYLELEKIRYGAHLQVSFQMEGETGRLCLAPLLLLPFVENAFKHGMSQQLDEAWLQIHLRVEQETLHFKVHNSKPVMPPRPPSTGRQTGIGLQNVSKRLQLIYPGLHRLRIMDEAETFLVSLTITLNEKAVLTRESYEDSMLAGR